MKMYRNAEAAPVLNINANGDILLDDQHVTNSHHVKAEFHHEIHKITAKVTIELATSTTSYEAFRAVTTARHNGSPNLCATAMDGVGYVGTIVRFACEPRQTSVTVTLDLDTVTITTSTSTPP